MQYSNICIGKSPTRKYFNYDLFKDFVNLFHLICFSLIEQSRATLIYCERTVLHTGTTSLHCSDNATKLHTWLKKQNSHFIRASKATILHQVNVKVIIEECFCLPSEGNDIGSEQPADTLSPLE